jgi:hypothetical protein
MKLVPKTDRQLAVPAASLAHKSKWGFRWICHLQIGDDSCTLVGTREPESFPQLISVIRDAFLTLRRFARSVNQDAPKEKARLK